MANSAGATYFVSFHRNSASTVGRGVEVYYYTGLSAQSTAARMAAPVQDALVACGFHNRGVKQANFSVLRRTSMPAILVELAFINNEAENAKLDSEFDRHRRRDSLRAALFCRQNTDTGNNTAAGNRASDDRTEGNRTSDNKSSGNEAPGDKSSGNEASGNKSSGNHPSGNKPA